MATTPSLADTSSTAKSPLPTHKHIGHIEIVFIGTALGLLILGLVAVRIYTYRGWTTINTPVTALTVDHDGTVWMVDPAGKVWVAKGIDLVPPRGKSIQIPLSDDETVTSLVIDKQGRIWAGTSSGVVTVRQTDGEWAMYTPEVAKRYNKVLQLIVDGQGQVWVRAESGLAIIDPGQKEMTYAYTNAGLVNIPADIATDEQGRVWVIDIDRSTGNYYIKVLDPDGEWVTRGENRGISHLAIDGQGRVWAGKEYPADEEVSVLSSDGTWSTYSFDNDPGRSGGVDAMLFDARGRLWVHGINLAMLDANGSWSIYEAGTSGLPREVLTMLVADGQDRIWIRTYSGKLIVLDADAAFPPKSIQSILRLCALAVVALPSAALASAWALALLVPGSIHVKTIRDFTIGFLGWFTILCLFWVVIVGQLRWVPGGWALAQLCFLIPLLPTIIGIIVLYRKRRSIALGALAAIAVNTIGIILIPPSVSGYPITAWILPFFFLGIFG